MKDFVILKKTIKLYLSSSQVAISSFVLLLSFNMSYAQYYPPTYYPNNNIYIIKEQSYDPTQNTINTIGSVQTQLQNRYDYNRERLSNTVNKINNDILYLKEERDVKNRIIKRWNDVIDQINSTKINFTMNSHVTDLINYCYRSINIIILEETED